MRIIFEPKAVSQPLCVPWMVNIGQKVDRSNGWKSLKRGSRYPKPSKWQAGLPWGMQWSKPDCGVCTDEQKPYTEAMRSDEVPHHAEVQAPRKGGSTEMVDMAGIDTRIFTLPREVLE